jgi:phospholipase C
LTHAREHGHYGSGKLKPIKYGRYRRGIVGGLTIRALLAAMIAAMWPALAAAQVTKFDHIVVIVQENRTPDNMFHGLQKYLPAADIADSGLDSKGATVPLKSMPLSVPFDLGHLHSAFIGDYDNGKMDGWDSDICVGHCPSVHAPYHYVQYADVAPYFRMAIDYSFANRMFQTNQGPSFPAHLFIFSGSSQITPKSPYFVADNQLLLGAAGCVAPPDQRVPLIGPDGLETKDIYPCIEHQALSDLLNQPPKDPTHPISWRYYTPSESNIYTAPNAIRHICEPKGMPPRCVGPDWRDHSVFVWSPQILLDIHFGNLPAVSWVIPTAQDSDHAYANLGTGPSWVASIVNAIGESKYWNNTVIFITWDDWGGWYDHVPPTFDATFGYYEYGFRVPLLVVSPYTRKGYVSQKRHDFGSILRFIENRFDLGLIPPGDFADARADDLMDFFDFSQPPRSFTLIPTKVPEAYFLDPSRPMLPPDDD